MASFRNVGGTPSCRGPRLNPNADAAHPHAVYPVSDHCDGRVFFSPGAPPLPGFREIIRWQRSKNTMPWPKAIPLRPRAPAVRPTGEGLVATWINHASFLLQSAETCLLVDPVYSDACGPFGRLGPRRVHPPGTAFADLPAVDVVLLSHDHYDHCDLPTLRRLSRRFSPLAITPLGNAPLLKRAGFRKIVELDWGQSHRVGPNGLVTLTPSQHWSNRLTGIRCGRLWGGFYLQLGQRRAHFVGDTGYQPELFKKIADDLGPPDLAMIPIGAYEPRWFMKGQHCNPAEAVQIHCDLRARTSLAMHWGTFKLTDEGREDPPEALRRALAEQNLAPAAFRILEPGEALVV